MTENIYPTYYELGKSTPILARRAIIRAYKEKGNISEVARLSGELSSGQHFSISYVVFS
ncbi:MAG: hypothetical protein ACP5J6_06040 [Candidatus Saccharicenans sp.]